MPSLIHPLGKKGSGTQPKKTPQISNSFILETAILTVTLKNWVGRVLKENLDSSESDIIFIFFNH